MASLGIDRATGATLTNWDHVAQSVEDIIRSRIGTRVMRRRYGSQLEALIDAPQSSAAILDLLTSLADALAAYEPRFEITGAQVDQAGADGVLRLHVTGVYLPRGHLGDRSVRVERALRVPI